MTACIWLSLSAPFGASHTHNALLTYHRLKVVCVRVCVLNVCVHCFSDFVWTIVSVPASTPVSVSPSSGVAIAGKRERETDREVGLSHILGLTAGNTAPQGGPNFHPSMQKGGVETGIPTWMQYAEICSTTV